MKFLDDYFSEYKRLLKFDKKEMEKILSLKKILKKVKEDKKKNYNIWEWWKRCNCKSF